MSIDLNEVAIYVNENIGDFHERRLNSLRKLKLSQILKRKNPYLFKAKNISDPHDLVKGLLDAHLSSQEEAIFGEFLEGLAIFVCNRVYGGAKSAATGIDLEFSKNQIIYIVSIKSGPNWGNSGQIAKMIDNFRKAQRILRTGNPRMNVVAVNGCCYGQEAQIEKAEYLKLCGQDFWEFISGNKNLYLEIIVPLGYRAKERNDEFDAAYGQIIVRFNREFVDQFCVNDRIDWEQLVRFNSESIRIKSREV